MDKFIISANKKENILLFIKITLLMFGIGVSTILLLIFILDNKIINLEQILNIYIPLIIAGLTFGFLIFSLLIIQKYIITKKANRKINC